MSRTPILPLTPNPFMGGQTRQLNRTIEQVGELASIVGVGGQIFNRGPLGATLFDASTVLKEFAFYAIIVNQGPNGDADFTDARYWVRSIRFTQAANALNTDSTTCYLEPSTQSASGELGGALWTVSTNFDEMLSGTHLLTPISPNISLESPIPSTGTIVRVYLVSAAKSSDAPGDYANQVYLFETIQATSSGGNLRPVYLNQVGGSNGNGSSEATFTYDVFTESGHTTAIALAQPMQIGSTSVPRVTAAIVTPATTGLAVFSTGSFYTLAWAFESYPLDTCGALTGGTS